MVKFKVEIIVLLVVRYSWPLPSTESAKVQGKQKHKYVYNKIDTNFVCHVLQN